jgi:hypothetical protein
VETRVGRYTDGLSDEDWMPGLVPWRFTFSAK